MKNMPNHHMANEHNLVHVSTLCVNHKKIMVKLYQAYERCMKNKKREIWKYVNAINTKITIFRIDAGHYDFE